MRFHKITNHNLKEILNLLDCDIAGAKIMAKKATNHLLYIHQMPVGAANILKQDALSIGADLAVPHGCVVAKEQFVDAVLIGSTKHFEILAKKEFSQPFGLQKLAKNLLNFVQKNNLNPKIMGVLNANEDSFFDKSRFCAQETLSRILQMIDDGADIVDIGAVSSRPGSKYIGEANEFCRLDPIFEIIIQNKIADKITLSIDSYSPLVVQKALDSGFTIINDITGLQDEYIGRLAAQYNASLVIMHMQGTPSIMQNNPSYENILLEIDAFFEQKILFARELGVKDIIIDVGIGFGKKLEHNLELLQNLEHFNHFGCEILIGASRKSLINEIIPTPVEERVYGSLAIHLDALTKGANIIRCHDVKEHLQSISVYMAIQNFNKKKIFS